MINLTQNAEHYHLGAIGAAVLLLIYLIYCQQQMVSGKENIGNIFQNF